MKYGHKPKKIKKEHPVLFGYQVVGTPSCAKRAMRRVYRVALCSSRVVLIRGGQITHNGGFAGLLRCLNNEMDDPVWKFESFWCATPEEPTPMYRLVVNNTETGELIPCKVVK